MTMLLTRIAAISEVLFAALMGVFALSIPVSSSTGESSALLMLVAQAGLALLAAIGLFRRQQWGWLIALCGLVLLFGPLLIAIYRAWRAGIGVGVTFRLPADAVRLVAVAWAAQLVVAVCFLVTRGKRPLTPETP